MRHLFTTPLGWALLLFASGLIMALRERLRRRDHPHLGVPIGLMAAALGVLFLAANPTVADALSAGLEATCDAARRPDWAQAGEAPEVLLVLSAGWHGRPDPQGSLSRAGLERTVEAVAAARRWPLAAVVVTGGPSPGESAGSGERMAGDALRLGLDPARLSVEPLAQTTQGNAVYGAAFVKARGWTRVAVVTSGTHMRRALGSLRKEGIDAMPLCAGRRVTEGRIGFEPTPNAGALAATTEALHERIGLAYYRLRGWIE